MGLALGLASSLVWGTADFLGGLYTRRLTLAPVAVGSQIAGLVALLIAAVFIGDIEGRALEIGLAAGACGAVGLSAFYRALATGTISIVSPVSACGALVPVGLALATGERPGALALAGSAAGLAGAVLASVHEIRGDHPAARSSIGLALLAALGIGGFLWFLGRAADGGHTLSALLGARLGSLALLSLGVALTRSSIAVPLSEVPAIALIGLLDTAANGLFAVAIQHGYITVVSVLGSSTRSTSSWPTSSWASASRAAEFGVALVLAGVGWWPPRRRSRWRGPGSNQRHRDFQSRALPTELPRRGRDSIGTQNERPPGRCYRSSEAARLPRIPAHPERWVKQFARAGWARTPHRSCRRPGRPLTRPRCRGSRPPRAAPKSRHTARARRDPRR